MKRICFTLRILPEHVEEYRREHQAVWPEMCAALQASGWRDYSLFLRPDGLLIGYLVTEDFEQAKAAMKLLPINQRWQERMAWFFDRAGQHADDQMLPLEEVFHLD